MAYEITKEEYQTIIDNTDMSKMKVFVEDVQGANACVTKVFSVKTGELRLARSEDFAERHSRYTVHSEMLPEEAKEPAPKLRIKVESVKELQNILNLYNAMRKDQENGS